MTSKFLLLCPDDFNIFNGGMAKTPMELFSLPELTLGEDAMPLDRVPKRSMKNVDDDDMYDYFKAAVIKKTYIVNCEGNYILVRSFWP